MSSDTTIHYGLFESKDLPFKTLPQEGASQLSSAPDNNLWSGTFINQVFQQTDFTSVVVPENAQFDSSSSDALGNVIGSAIDIQTVSFRNCFNRPLLSIPQVLSSALAISFSLKVLDLTNCGIDTNSAKNISKSIPGNKTVQDWIFSQNPIGDEGCTFLNEALVRSAAQRVSFRSCQVANVVRVCDGLMKITGLYAFDLRENPGYDDSNNREYCISKQDLLSRNANMLYPRSQKLLVPFGVVESNEQQGNNEGDDDDQQQQQDGEEGEQQQQEELNEEEIQQQQQEALLASTARGGRMKRKAELPAVFGSASRQRLNSSRANSPSVTIDTRSNPIKPNQQTRDINDGMDRWKEVKNEYNNYIGGPNGRRTNVSLEALKKRAITPPTYILGKRVDQITRYGPSRAFRESTVVKRVATPDRGNNMEQQQEQQQNPNQQQQQKPTNLRNEISYLEDEKNDPRTIGYRIRKVKESKQEPWSRSNDKRNLRFGIDERQNGRGIVLKEHQAPDPGFYKIPDEWEERARKLRAQAASRPKPTLAGTTGPRGGATGPAQTHHYENPGPGSYDIP